MYLKEITNLPIRGERKNIRKNNSLKMLLIEFCDSNMDFAEVIYHRDEYSSASSLYSGLKKASDTMEHIPVSVEFIQGNVYLRRVD